MNEYAAIVICYGQEQLTNAVLQDLHREHYLVDVYLVDNKGDYKVPEWLKTNATILRPGLPESLRWCRGTNWGYNEVYKINPNYKGWFFLNNDIRLSSHFCYNLIQVEQEHNLGTVAPLYDDVWPQQKGNYRGPALTFRPEPILREVGFFDGAGWYATQTFLERIHDHLYGPVLDEIHFGKFGWGAIEDYCIRARRLANGAWVSGSAYMNHFRAGTYKAEPETEYEKNASQEMNEGMHKKHGASWGALLEL